VGQKARQGLNIVMTNSAPRPLRGRTVVITGASSGIGAVAARRLADLGATVAVVGRSAEKTAAVARLIGGQAHQADFSRLDDVRRLAGELLAAYERIDILANNAGAIHIAGTASADGHELTLQVNYLAPFLLTNLLLARLATAPDGAKVINTGSNVYRHARLDIDHLDGPGEPDGAGDPGGKRRRVHQTYPASKLATILFTRELALRTRGTGITASAFHPGVIATDLGRESAFFRLMNSRLGRIVLSTPERGAEPLLHLATVADPQTVNGAYFNRLKPEEPANPQARDPSLARRLWERSAQLTGVPALPPPAGESSPAPSDG
jgi:NAD(P)-dependent dehydrogenase (short-subunit alcohol dehydrogenase family)